MDTVFALASAEGRAGVAVVRVSGPQAHKAGAALCGSIPKPSMFAVRPVKGRAGALIDRALVLTFEGPNSFTGEDVVELHLHGSIAIIRSVLSELSQCDGLRLAEPGEFTRRALENGKMDLTQVEGLADLIDAETEQQRLQAMETVEGALAGVVDRWRSDLIRAASLLEVTIDFVDEDVPVDVRPEVLWLLSHVIEELEVQVEQSYVAERVRTGFEVAIIGAPNVGKSSLLNYLSGREAAITSEIAGTTRDVIEVRMDLQGLPVTFLDTAGVRETDDIVEAKGVALTKKRAEAADLRLFLGDLPKGLQITAKEGDIHRSPKADLFPSNSGISGVTGEGVSDLTSEIVEQLKGRVSNRGLASRVRHRDELKSAATSLVEAKRLLDLGADYSDLSAEEMHSAMRSLSRLVGRIDVENLLDEIFSSFCLGK